MPEINIRPAIATDIKALVAIDHTSESDYVLQLEFAKDPEQADISLRRMRLPRAVTVYYPRQVSAMLDIWAQSTLMLVALTESGPVGYLRLTDQLAPGGMWITDLAVNPEFRRQGIATALLLSAQQWGLEQNLFSAFMEMTSKNFSAMNLSQKLGFDLCGYNELYYPSRDVALFFGRELQ